MTIIRQGKVIFSAKGVLVKGSYNGTATVKIIECAPSTSS